MTAKENNHSAGRFGPGSLPEMLTYLLVLSLIALMTLGGLAASPAATQEMDTGEGSSGEEPSYEAGELSMVRAINDYRRENGLSRLEVADTASLAAEHHSEDMANYDFFEHTTIKSDYYKEGANLAYRMAEEGYDYNTYRSENIAAGYESVETTLQQWKDSPEHDRNMLNPELEVIGIGKACSEASSYGCYWTTDFGAYTPDSARTVDAIEGSSERSSERSSSKPAEPTTDDATESDEQTSDERVANQSTTDQSTADQYSEGNTDTGSETEPNSSSGEEQYADGDTEDRNSSSGTPDSGTDPASFDRDEFMSQTHSSEQSGEQEGDAPGSGQGDEQCESAMEGFEASPFEEDFGEKLEAAIREEVSCEMKAAGIATAKAGEEGSSKTVSDENSSGVEDSETTSMEQTSSGEDSSEETGDNGSTLDQTNEGSAGQGEDSGQDRMDSSSSGEESASAPGTADSTGEGGGAPEDFFEDSSD